MILPLRLMSGSVSSSPRRKNCWRSTRRWQNAIEIEALALRTSSVHLKMLIMDAGSGHENTPLPDFSDSCTRQCLSRASIRVCAKTMEIWEVEEQDAAGLSPRMPTSVLSVTETNLVEFHRTEHTFYTCADEPGFSLQTGSINPRFIAIVTAWVLSFAPNLHKMLLI